MSVLYTFIAVLTNRCCTVEINTTTTTATATATATATVTTKQH